MALSQSDYLQFATNLKNGKNEEQKACIDFFLGTGGGCFSKGMTCEEYRQKLKAKLGGLDTKQMALKKLGIDEEEVQEINPVQFEGFVFNDKDDNFAKRDLGNNDYVSSDYQVTWLFFGNDEVFIYRYSFSMITDSKKESADQYFYKDVTNFTTVSDTYQKWESEQPGGCGKNKSTATAKQVSVESEAFGIVVPGDKLTCAMSKTDDHEDSIKAMRNKLREKKK